MIRSFVGGIVAVAVLGACDQAGEDRAANQAAKSVRESNQALRQFAEQVKQGSDQVARAAKSGAREVGEYLSDAAISARVKAALLADPSVDGMKIDVDTREGSVTLRGSLPDGDQSARAEDIARRVNGVRAVHNSLQLTASQPAP